MALPQTLSTSNRVPGIYLRVTFGAGAGSVATGPRRQLIVAYKLAAGTATADVPIQTLSEEDAIAFFGRGSEAHRATRAALAVNRTLDLWVLPLAAPGGGGAATGTYTVTGTATEGGTITVIIGGEIAEVGVASGDAFGVVAAAMDVAVDGLADAPVTSGVAAGVVTLTARHLGIRGDDIRFRSTGTVAGIVVTPSGGTLTGGSGTDIFTTAQTNLAAERFQLIAIAHTDLTSAQNWRDFVESQAGETIGIRQAVIAASVDTLANATTFATGINAVRGRAPWLEESPLEPAILTAVEGAVMTSEEELDLAAPMSREHDTRLPGLLQPVAISAQASPGELVSALNNGLSPIVFDNAANARIQRSITSRSQNNAATAPDFTTYDTAKQTVPDGVADILQASWPAFVLRNPKLTVDPVDGSPPPPGVATPSTVRDWILGILRDQGEAAGAAAILENVAANEDLILVEIAPSPDGRVIAQIAVDVIEGLYQFTGDVRQVA